MNVRNTLFIVGAGASVDFGLPVGDALANRIQETASAAIEGKNETGQFAGWLQERYRDQQSLKQRQAALLKIAERIYPAASIDRFIDQNSHDKHVEEMGKALIVAEIAKAEQNSTLSLDHGERVDLRRPEIATSWCDTLLKMIVDGSHWLKVDEVGSNISIVCFNYDRCIERYLISGLQQAFGLTYGGAWDIVSNLNIIHP